MPARTNDTNALSLPAEPEREWTKPTWGNTKGGKNYVPTHEGLFAVEFQPAASAAASATEEGRGEKEKEKGETEEYSSRLVALQDSPPNAVLTKLTNLSLAPAKAYSSVQFGTGPRDHFELNSDLLFMNHSCAPTAELHLPPHQPGRWELRSASGGIKKGEGVTFFYPSTEWDMAQGFDCACGAKECLGKIRGARYIELEELEKRGWVNEHIRTLKYAQQLLKESGEKDDAGLGMGIA